MVGSAKEYFKMKKQELIAVYLEKVKILKVQEEIAIDYVLTIIDGLRTMCGNLACQGPFTSSYCLLELFHQIVSCVYGNEKLSRLKLIKRRGFGLNAEMFSNELNLSALGLKLSYPFLKNISAFFSGDVKKETVSFLVACLYFKEVTSLEEEAVSSDVMQNLIGLIKSHLGCLTDEESPEKNYNAVSLPYFVDIYERKYRRNLIKKLTAKVLLELWLSSRTFQESLCSGGLQLFISNNGKDFKFHAGDLNSTLLSLKQWLRTVSGQELASLWYQYVYKKVQISQKDEFALVGIDFLLAGSAKDYLSATQIDIRNAFVEPDLVARHFIFNKAFSCKGSFGLF